jgi:hypothetical protein
VHFEAVIAACELPVPRGKSKNRIKTFFWGAPSAGASMSSAQRCLKRGVSCLQK